MRAHPAVVPCLAALIALAASGSVAASPPAQTPRARAQALARQHEAAVAELARDRAVLAATRSALDAQQARYDARLEVLRLRLRGMYADPELPVLAQIAMDPGQASARLELAQVMARADAAMVEEYRRSLLALHQTERSVQARKQVLSARVRVLAARRARAQARLGPPRVSAAADAPADAVSGATRAGVTRGLPEELLRNHDLPGVAPLDAATGVPLSFAVPAGGIARGVEGPRRMSMQVGWYAPTMRRTAAGDLFDPQGLTAAHRTLPLGTVLRLRRGNDTVVVRVNDRGPFVAGRDLDVTPAAARMLHLTGVDQVQAEVVNRP